MPHFSFLPDLDKLPAQGPQDRLNLGFERWAEAAQDSPSPQLQTFMTELAKDAKGQALLAALFGHSPFLTQAALREAEHIQAFAELGPDQAWQTFWTGLSQELAGLNEQNSLMAALRRAKRRAALLIALADISQAWSLQQVTRALSDLAGLAVDASLSFLLRQANVAGDLHLPCPDDPLKGSGVIVIGMGKLGAWELNYSSDIDLIVLYDAACHPEAGDGLGAIMVRLTRQLVRMLEERTGDGYVFRTDLRLRPDPGSTPLALSLTAAETYYEAFGQNWERAAMIKARAVGGDKVAGNQFLNFLRPFIWRKNLDFAAIQDIHSIKRQINAHRGHESIAIEGHNIKLGRGGIREIEFFAQTQQLIWGGRNPALRLSGTLESLEALVQAGQVEARAAQDMEAAYVFLRTLEHRLQMIDDRQTQTLPTDPAGIDGLGKFMGYGEAARFRSDLVAHLRNVEQHYARLFEEAPDLGASEGSLIFTGSENDPETLATLSRMGFDNAEAVCSTIRGWHHGRIRCTRSARARELLTELTPALLSALARTAQPDNAFVKLDDFLARLPAGVQLFSMMTANPHLLELLAVILGDAPRLAGHLSRHPALLDAVLSQDFFDPLAPVCELKAELDRLLASALSFEETLDLARRWASDQKFRIGVQMLKSTLSPETAGAAYAAVAETTISVLLPHIEADQERVHGRIPNARLAVLAMGKLGGREMTATSDLDLILIYDAPPDCEGSDGPRPMTTPSYYARLTQRLVNALTAQGAGGSLYEVDMRLRPSGRAGPLAASLDSFKRYHAEAAWTWEYQALTRARAVAGPAKLCQQIADVILDALTAKRDPAKLKFDVADMRQRINKEHKGASPWDIKYRPGGLIDIEFIAQYLQLREAHDHPDVLAFASKDALTRLKDCGCLDADAHAALAHGLHLWTALQGVLRLTLDSGFSEDAAPEGVKSLMIQAAGAVDFEDLKHQMSQAGTEVRALFDQIIGTPQS
ncbi:MAG: bifunctional [glutamine synthetase] adenylyltransferase/[glutamine synthetase]-adenylyl-L-tyrosine phosphorylase [Alphaproteobacteria bacterium]|nr:bifunctional [glutamine synthetase] adenylyltransferase/[glutamine synthetase]-adenylyl-L-tyrosine phosphorylase [Alphaproteobacteria bacterium]